MREIKSTLHYCTCMTTNKPIGTAPEYYDNEDDITLIDTDDDDGKEASLDTEEQIEEAMQNLRDIYPELRQCDEKEEQLVAQFVSGGCGCSKKCSSYFSGDHVRDMRDQCSSLSHTELDMAVLGQLTALTNTDDNVVTESRHKERVRQRIHRTFYHAGKIVCIKTFRFLHAIGETRLDNLTKSLRQNGLTPRIHGNTSKRPKHSLSFESTEYVVRFLLSYVEQNGLLLPGRIPGYSRTDIKLLPSSVSKRGIWNAYCQAATSNEDVHTVAYTTFCRLWRSLLPSVIIMKPMTDLCWVCHQNSNAILRMANSTEAAKSDTLKDAVEHLRVVQIERSFYKTTCDECRDSVRAHFTVDGRFQPPSLSSKIPANSNNIKVHYSFDYVQQVHFPSDPLQPGPIYFLTPRKCSIFGMHCESIPRQVNFLTDEAGECGKGANNVVSRLHYFFETHGLGEKTVYLHADNCTGQNKNNCMVQYLVWRALTNRHSSITLSFLVVGHTKFSPDWCFGLLKRHFRRTRVGSLKGIAQVVNESADCNFSQLVCSDEGTPIVNTYDWTSFFAPHLKKISGIKKYHHFRCDSTKPGKVFVKVHADTEEIEIDLMKHKPGWAPDHSELPPIVPPKGLSAERQWYLYESIWPFCPEGDKDLTCPLPTVPKPGSAPGTPARPSRLSPPPVDLSPVSEPPAKRRRCCAICKKEGHNSRTCPEA